MAKTLKTQPPASMTHTPFRNPLAQMVSRGLVDDMFERFLTDNGHSQMENMMNAAMDIAETDHAFEVHMDLPGVNPDNVDIQIDNNTLTIRGERSEQIDENDEEKQFHRMERYSGSFARSVVLPNSINEDETVAQFKDGVLKIIIPKTEDAKPRRITIRS